MRTNKLKKVENIMMDKCLICYGEELEILAKTDSCDHRFCYECLSEWAKINNYCPVCKKKFLEINQYDLFEFRQK